VLRALPPERTQAHEILGADQGEGGRAAQRLDEISYRYYQRPDLWRAIAAVNDISDPLHVPAGTVLRIPQL
jgi:nucleoid-associated protein YgaU